MGKSGCVKVCVSKQLQEWSVNYSGCELLKIARCDRYTKATETTDVFGRGWLLAWLDRQEFNVAQSFDLVQIRSRNRFVTLQPQQLVFVPPFSIAHWRMQPGVVKWNAFLSDLPLPVQAPVSPSIYNLNPRIFQGIVPLTYEEICSFFRSQTPQLSVIQEKTRSTLAPQIKIHLDRNYRESQPVHELAKLMDVSRVVLSRSFQNAYSLSPLQYRQRLRMADALYRIAQGSPISQSLHEGGFSCASEFNRQIQNLYGFTPRRMCPPPGRVRSSGLDHRP